MSKTREAPAPRLSDVSPHGKPTALSLFAGCGGLCEGIRLAGFDIVAAVEQDRFAAQTYRYNFPEVLLFEGDIKSFLRPRSRIWAQQAARFDHLTNAVDLVFGGPPCQGFSQIGPRDAGDARNGLYTQFIRILRTARPRVFLMENVPNMLTIGEGRFRKRVLSAFRSAGYTNCGVRILNASDFGVPQVRKRAVFFGVRDDVGFPYNAGSFLEHVAGANHSDPVSVWEAIGDLPASVSGDNSPLPYLSARKHMAPFQSDMRLDSDGPHYLSDYKLSMAGEQRLLYNHHTKEIQERRARLIAHLAPGARGDSLPPDVWTGIRPQKWRRLDPTKPAYTLLAQMHRDLSEWVHPTEPRWITVREAARLQSFHDGFVFKSSEWQMLKQIGNAVPPLLGRGMGAVASHALAVLSDLSTPVPLEVLDAKAHGAPKRLAA